MALHESKPEMNARRNRYRFIYIAVFMISTSVTAVVLSFNGYISLDPLSAFVASLFAGFAFLIFQVTYVRFIANSSQRSRPKQPDLR